MSNNDNLKFAIAILCLGFALAAGITIYTVVSTDDCTVTTTTTEKGDTTVVISEEICE